MNCLSLCYKCEDMVKEEIDIIVKHYTDKLLVEVEQVVLAQTSNIVQEFVNKLNDTIVSHTLPTVLAGSSVFTFPPIVPSGSNVSSQ